MRKVGRDVTYTLWLHIHCACMYMYMYMHMHIHCLMCTMGYTSTVGTRHMQRPFSMHRITFVSPVHRSAPEGRKTATIVQWEHDTRSVLIALFYAHISSAS